MALALAPSRESRAWKNLHCHTDRASWDAILVTVVAFGALMWKTCAQSHRFGLGRVGGGGDTIGGGGGGRRTENRDHIYIYIYNGSCYITVYHIMLTPFYYTILYYTILCYPLLSYTIIYYPILSYTILNYPIQSYTIL